MFQFYFHGKLNSHAIYSVYASNEVKRKSPFQTETAHTEQMRQIEHFSKEIRGEN